MRASVRPLFLAALICSPTVSAHAQVIGSGGSGPSIQSTRSDGVNDLSFASGSPTPTTGGVNVSVAVAPTTGYSCTRITIRVIDNATGMTLDTYRVDNPGQLVTHAFTGLGGSREIEVTVDAIFQSGGLFDPKHIEAVVTTL